MACHFTQHMNTNAIPSDSLSKYQLRILWTILLAGSFLRIFHYLDNRSLWEDEVFLASSLVKMNFYELATAPLDYRQRAPIGFLWAVRLIVGLLDNKEMSLRLFPLLCGVSSMFLFLPVARYFLRTQISLIVAVFLVSFVPPLVYHSVEVKQYGTEFLASVFSLFLFTKFYKKKSLGSLLLWGLGGAITLWFSFSSLFILAGIGTAVSLTSLIKRDWRMLFTGLIPFSIWLVSFVVQYVFFISKFPEEEWLTHFWRNREAFMPFPPQSVKDVSWPFVQIYSLIRYPLGLSWIELDYKQHYSQLTRVLARMPVLPFLTGLLGLWAFYSKQKKHLLLLASPVIIALLASALELYPLRERLTLFLAPIFILVIAKGIEQFYEFKLSVTVKNTLVAFLLFPPLLNSVVEAWHTDLFGDYKKSYQREAMQYLEKNYKPGDVVYVYWNNIPSFQFYQEVYGFPFHTVYGSDLRPISKDFESYFENLSLDFGKFRGNKRLWLSYKPYNTMKLGDIENTPAWYYHNVNAHQRMFNKVSSFGTIIDSFPTVNKDTDIKLYLIELAKKQPGGNAQNLSGN